MHCRCQVESARVPRSIPEAPAPEAPGTADRRTRSAWHLRGTLRLSEAPTFPKRLAPSRAPSRWAPSRRLTRCVEAARSARAASPLRVGRWNAYEPTGTRQNFDTRRSRGVSAAVSSPIAAGGAAAFSQSWAPAASQVRSLGGDCGCPADHRSVSPLRRASSPDASEQHQSAVDGLQGGAGTCPCEPVSPGARA